MQIGTKFHKQTDKFLTFVHRDKQIETTNN